MFLLFFFFFSQAAKGVGAREWADPESFIVCRAAAQHLFFPSFKTCIYFLLFQVELETFSQSHYFSPTFILLSDACTTVILQRLLVCILIKAGFSTRTIYPICPLTCLLKIPLSWNCKGITALFDSMRLGSPLSFFFSSSSSSSCCAFWACSWP